MNILSHLKDLKTLFLIPLNTHTWLFYLPLLFLFIFFSFFKFSYFHCDISHYRWLCIYTFLSCKFWIWFLVLRLFLIFSVCKYMFPTTKKACPNYLTKLTYILANYHSLFFVQAFFYFDPRYIDIYVPGDRIFLCRYVNV